LCKNSIREEMKDMIFFCYTQQEIAEAVELDRTVITRKIIDLCKMENFPNSTKLAINYQDDNS